jgi:8-oxo-dGTP diphosphatase
MKGDKMEKCNCIVVFNSNKDKILFCKRVKNPYKELYNFVGGKIEAGESSINAAYRELQEETGISRSHITLHRLMDITYYYQDLILEFFVGQLREDMKLVQEINPILWLPLTENFTDESRFAGEQNIGHIVNIALKYPLSQEAWDNLNNGSLCIGVDGCKGGWIAAVYDHGNLRIEKYNVIEEIIERYPHFNDFLIDMVIGFPSNQGHIRPDTTARSLIPGRTSTIFAVPSREAVYMNTEAEQIEANKRILEKGLAKQTMAIMTKMRELDVFLNANSQYKNVIKESHPEVCFARLNGTVVMSKKVDFDGMSERVHILKKYIPDLEISVILTKAKELKCKADDIVDAICLAVTANLNCQGKGDSIPAEPMYDDNGLMMRMVIPAVTME